MLNSAASSGLSFPKNASDPFLLVEVYWVTIASCEAILSHSLFWSNWATDLGVDYVLLMSLIVTSKYCCLSGLGIKGPCFYALSTNKIFVV